MHITDNFKKYLSGFFDGDGSITVEKLSNGYTLRIKFCQSNENILKKIQQHYPFMRLDGGQRNGRENNRCEFQLRASGKQIEPLVNDLLKYCILKYEQLLEASKFFEYINVVNTIDKKESIYNKLKQLKVNSSNKPYERICVEYIAGLFDAEGSVGIYNSTLRIKLTQKSDIVILEKIANMYNNKNKIDNYAISFYGVNSKKFLNDIKKYTIYKNSQIEAALNYIETIHSDLTNDIIELRKKLKDIITNEKTIDIDLMNCDQEKDKDYLIKCFNLFKNLTTHDLMYTCKFNEIKKLKVSKQYENKIYNIDWKNEWMKFDIEPELEFCENPNQLSLYNYLKKKTSSLPTTATVGRQIRILVKDKNTNKYIGLLCLSSDVYSLGERDIYISRYNIDNLDKNELLKRYLNISCCVPLQPFGYNTCGGKLLVSLVFSKEVFEYHLKKYNQPIYGFVTTSIHGKSIQYDRLKELKFIGYTKGYGSVQIPDELYDVCKDYNNKYKVVIMDRNRIDRFNFLKNILKHLNLDQEILQHNNKRGIYFGFLFKSKLNNEYDKSELQSISEKYIQWKQRWCNNRLNNLSTNNNFKNDNCLYTIENLNTIQFTQFKLPNIQESISISETEVPVKIIEKKKKNVAVTDYAYLLSKKLSDKIIIEIMVRKKEIITTQEISDYVKEKYNVYINRNIISKLWNNQIDLPDSLKNTQEYKEMISNKKKRTKKLTKFTQEELNFVKNNVHLDLSNCVKEFYAKFNKTITKEYIAILHNKNNKDDLI